MRKSILLALACALGGTAGSTRPALGRRALLSGVACAAVGCAQPASAAIKDDLRTAEEALRTAEGNEAINTALARLLELTEDYGGLPTQAMTEELVGVMRAKRSSTQGNSKLWNGISEEAYNRLMRSVDPWRVTELEPVLARSIYTFPFAYIALLVVQQVRRRGSHSRAHASASDVDPICPHASCVTRPRTGRAQGLSASLRRCGCSGARPAALPDPRGMTATSQWTACAWVSGSQRRAHIS